MKKNPSSKRPVASKPRRVTKNPGNHRLEYTTVSRQFAARVRALISLKTFRDSSGKVRPMSINELGRMAGLAGGALSRILSGDRGKWLSLEAALRIAVALEASLDFLATGVPPDPKWRPPLGFDEAYRRELTVF